MRAMVSAKGFTNVILVLNMKRFVHNEDQARFERIRGRKEFAYTLRKIWPERLSKQEKFITIEEEKYLHGRPDTRSPEQVGFAVGVFRSLMLEKYTFPSYAIDKDKVIFPEELMTNFQFKSLFLEMWTKWNIYVRPTNTGFFIIRLTHRYPSHARSFINLAQDVLRIQEPLDIRSAQNWLRSAREKYIDNPEKLAVRERSVQAFLEWLGVEEDYVGDALYYPVHWRIPMEACKQFVEVIGSEIFTNGNSPVRLVVPKPSISIPLHDSYIVHHFIDLLANAKIVKRSRPNQKNSNSQISINLNDIRTSNPIKQAFKNLSEGAILKSGLDEGRNGILSEKTASFPKHRWRTVDDIVKHNQASWDDELCFMNSKTAIILPSRRWLEDELLVSSTPGSTLQVNYRRYWDAIERLIEFVLEIHVMAQLLESASYKLLGEIADKIHETQSKLFGGNISMDDQLPDLVASAAYLRYQAALCQSLSHPQLWSRADFALTKANYLLDQLGVPNILEHVERNINSIVEFVNHVDELYLADLSEKNNENANLVSMMIAAVSLTLTILILPSFWADLGIDLTISRYAKIIPLIENSGNWLSVSLVIVAILFFGYAVFRLLRIGERLNKISKEEKKGPFKKMI